MSKALRVGSALSAIALATALGGCATSDPGIRVVKIDKSRIGLATKALIALNANQVDVAISYAERAVENSPRDAGFRTLLGKAYFQAGRFASAESAFRDSLSLVSNQPNVVLKLALAQIAQGKNQEALGLIHAARGLLDASDAGLAYALAGDPQTAVALLDEAAREQGADAQLRQNLALAHALAGDWTAARVVAAQDLSADLVDSRIQQWMSFAKPARPGDQIAALTGIQPAAIDAGQPLKLALNAPAADVRTARVAAPAPAIQPAPQAAVAPVVQAAAAAPAGDYPALPESVVVPQSIDSAPAPAFAAAPVPVPVPVAAEPAPAPIEQAAMRQVEGVLAKTRQVRPASLPKSARNTSGAVVQIGAYGSPRRVAIAWQDAARRYPVLRAYSPMSATFESSAGLVHRLSVRGFGSVREAASLCASLRRAGGSCFVRSVAGDAPVRIALR